MEFAEVVRRRRMVRHFADEPVERSVLERIAAAAQRTPSAGFSQGQRLVVVTDPERRRAVADAVEEGEYVEAGFDPWLSRCAAQFIPCVSEQVYHERYREPDKLDDEGDEIAWPTPYWWMDVGCTVMLVLLAAVDEGLAAGFAGAPTTSTAFVPPRASPATTTRSASSRSGGRCPTAARRRCVAAGGRLTSSSAGTTGAPPGADPTPAMGALAHACDAPHAPLRTGCNRYSWRIRPAPPGRGDARGSPATKGAAARQSTPSSRSPRPGCG